MIFLKKGREKQRDQEDEERWRKPGRMRRSRTGFTLPDFDDDDFD